MRKAALYSSLVIAIPFSAAISAYADSFSAECAARDLRAVIAIDRYGETGEISGEQLKDALIAVLNARSVCEREGTGKAVPLYESVFAPFETSAKKHEP
jgi:hypothetical protein